MCKIIRLLTFTAVSLSLLLPLQSYAELPLTIMTGNDLAQYCNDINLQNVEAELGGNYAAIKGDPKDATICLIYIEGVTSAYKYGWNRGIESFLAVNSPNLATYKKNYNSMYVPYAKAEQDLSHLFCIPSDATMLQLQKVVTKYLDNHPDILNKAAFDLVISAFTDAYPGGCKEQPK